MRNRQPFYHRAVVLFTATREIDQKELQVRVSEGLRRLPGLVQGSVEIEEIDADAGDPHDLM